MSTTVIGLIIVLGGLGVAVVVSLLGKAANQRDSDYTLDLGPVERVLRRFRRRHP